MIEKLPEQQGNLLKDRVLTSKPLEDRELLQGFSIQNKTHFKKKPNTVKLGNKERFDKEKIGIKEPFPVTNLPFTS